jgi:hypothetical protein
MPRIAKPKKKPSEKEASGDDDGFESVSSVGVSESTSLNMQRKSTRMARTKSKVAVSKKKSSKAATSTSKQPPSPEADVRKRPPEELVALDEKLKGKVTTLWQRVKPKREVVVDILQARIPAHHSTRTVYPFAISAVCNSFVLCLLHAIYALIEKHMYHLTMLVKMLYSLLTQSIEDFSVR